MNYVSYIDFIKSNILKIRQFSQDGFAWKNGYSDSFLKMVSEANADFESVINNLPDYLDRAIVHSFFCTKDNLYNGFVACMLWGGINATRCAKGHKGDLKTTDAYRAFTHKKTDVVKKLTSVKKYLHDGKIEKAFTSLADPKGNHIPGIGVSFFTKLLFFMSKEKEIPRLLIYDKWSTYIHCALLIDDNKENVLSYYRRVNKDETLSKAKCEFELYKGYLEIMKKTAEANEIGDVSQLEAFLFGYALNRRGHREEKGRRAFLKKYVVDYFAQENRMLNKQATTTGALTRTTNKRRESSEEPAKVTHLTTDSTIRSRHVLFGYSVPFEGKMYYLFVGETTSFHYIELLTGKRTERIEDCSLFHELKKEGFGDLDGKDFIYKRLKPYDEIEAKHLLGLILKRMTGGNEE